MILRRLYLFTSDDHKIWFTTSKLDKWINKSVIKQKSAGNTKTFAEMITSQLILHSSSKYDEDIETKSFLKFDW